MDPLTIPDHYEWWITHENVQEGQSSVRCATAFHEDEAREFLKVFREESAGPGDVYECQRVLVHRTAEKLDW